MTKNTTESATVLPKLSRRTFLGAAGATVAGAAVPWSTLEAEVAQLKSEGWEARPCACNVCGGYCGLLAMHKKGEPYSPQTVKIMPNPSHPQRGCCARGASAVWAWAHPLRLKKPMKRVGEKGEGKFEEISWDQALDEIAAKVKAICEKDGERAVAMTSHNFSSMQKWFGAALGTPNVIGHSSTCNSASIMGRRMVFGKGFDSAGKVEPDYERVKYLLCIGRTLNCAMGVSSVLARARQQGARVLFVDPRMPEGAFGDAEWLPIKPGTDSAFIYALINVAIRENLVDRAFLAKWTNAPYLVQKNSMKPVTAAECCPGATDGSAYVVMDKTSGELRPMGLVKDEKGTVTGFAEPEGVDPDLDFTGTVTGTDGATLEVETAYAVFARTASKWTPEEASAVTGIPAERIVTVAREFFTLGGVCDDGWYSSRNGNDNEAYQLMSALNLFTGSLDQKGGFVVTQGGGLKMPSASSSGTKGKGPAGQTWEIPFGKALDKEIYPESSGTFSTVFRAILKEEPYPIRAVFVTGSTMFHREANSNRMAEALRALELLVVQDILPHEIIDYADYVLPSTMFLEWHEYAGVKWALDGNIQLNSAGLTPPEGCEARHEIWQFCEILRRAYPDRAADRLGYAKECRTTEEWKAWFDGMTEKAWAKFIASKNESKPGEGDRIAAEIAEKGWCRTAEKKFGVYPYKKPFGTPTGKPEIVSFLCASKYQEKGLKGLTDFEYPKAYTQPKPRSDEFFLVSGKDSASCSGVTIFTWPTKFLGDRTLWMHPVDAERLGISTGDMIEVTGIDTGVKGEARVTVTNRVMPGSLFSHGFSGGVRTKNLPPEYAWVREGINSHWFATGFAQPVCGNLANNSSVRVKRL